MNIYVIAGPPGIGKSSRGFEYIPEEIEIIEQDLAGQQYKKEGFIDYQHLATYSTNNFIKSHLFKDLDFALELNLGIQVHYDYLISIASVRPENKVHLILFFTDTIEICLERAKLRHERGGHLVKPEIIFEMYENKIPLLKENAKVFETKTYINVENKLLEKVRKDNQPKWVLDNNLFE